MKITILLLLVGLSFAQWAFPARTYAQPLKGYDGCAGYNATYAPRLSFLNLNSINFQSRNTVKYCSDFTTKGNGEIKFYIY
ncbi:hypothetical protein [Pseudomonas marginalis]|uniref:hypothetical protein n=1 Tax=Pseudomonas marginalis TaxID=298 RepID=UPI002A36127F|nr:hypothetical protein [Pseudomonas marginalis]WPN26363.1 hypothetical protein QMK57_13745 [Pseudomonas marginalis]